MVEGRWRWWGWGLVWAMPVLLAVWIAVYFWVFGREWPLWDGALVFGYATVVVFWGVPAWSLGILLAMFFVRRKARLLVAFGVTGLLAIVFWREFLAELGGVF